MICEKTVKKVCKDYSRIENYEKAINDKTQTWHCHHRLETHNSDGERRLVDITAEELKALGMYYDRPADELIFLTSPEHTKLHMVRNHYSKGHTSWIKGKHHTEETKQKISETKRGKKHGSPSDETRKKLSESLKGKNKGKHHSEETRKRMSETHKGERNPLYGKHHSEETKKKQSTAKKGRHWKLVDGKRVWTKLGE